jgi:uncharacterized membrane protein
MESTAQTPKRAAVGESTTETTARATPLGIVLGAAAVVMGLAAGFIFAYSSSVMPGLADSGDRVFVEAMQDINEATENPVFFAAYFGAFLLTGAAAVMLGSQGGGPAFRWTIAALVLYGVALAVTIGVNVPLNDDLANAGNPDQIADLAAVRDDFEGPWVAWNIVRTVVSTLALGALAWALLLYGRKGSSSSKGGTQA